MKKPITWTIAGSDSGGGAGIQADLKTFQSLGVHGCSVITAVTSQNTREVNGISHISPDHIASQISSLKNDLPAQAIKVGMLGNTESINAIQTYLRMFPGHVVLDPVLIASSGNRLFCMDMQDYCRALQKIFHMVDVLTPNISEVECLLRRQINSYDMAEKAAQDLLSMGVKSVLIKGGHFDNDTFSQDYWTNGKESFWLACKKQRNQNYHGTGCTLSSAITAALAHGYSLKDALVIGKMYVNQSIRLAYQLTSGPALITHQGWPENEFDLPYISSHFLQETPPKFPDCTEKPLGIYPVVDHSSWLEKLLPLGVKTVQLRIKNKTGEELENEIKRSVQLAQQYDARLFVNDYWELAIKYNAYGVHLGQEDLNSADVEKIRKAGLRLGLSTHCYYEVARAHNFNPSYIACGPIFPTTSKVMPFAPQGIEQLKRWRRMLNYPIVAIGGIDSERLPEVLAAKANGVAMISAITQASDPLGVTHYFLDLYQSFTNLNKSLINL